MTEVWLLAAIPFLAWLLARARAKRLLSVARIDMESSELVTAAEIDQLVRELSTSIRPSSKVTSPNLYPESNHVWSSPTGKRVYMN